MAMLVLHLPINWTIMPQEYLLCGMVCSVFLGQSSSDVSSRQDIIVRACILWSCESNVIRKAIFACINARQCRQCHGIVVLIKGNRTWKFILLQQSNQNYKITIHANSLEFQRLWITTKLEFWILVYFEMRNPTHSNMPCVESFFLSTWE